MWMHCRASFCATSCLPFILYCIAAEEALPSRTRITLMNPTFWIDAIRRRAAH
jgi:hypothetical protein